MIAAVEPTGGGTSSPDLSRLAVAGSVVVLLADVPGLLDLGPDEAAAVVAGWVDAGDLELWPDFPDGPALALSSSAGARLGLEMIDTRDGGLRWRPAGHPNEKPAQRKGEHAVNETDLTARAARSGRLAVGLDGFPDHRAVDPAKAIRDDPAEVPPAKTSLGRWLAKLGGGLKPILIIGVGVTWPVACDVLKRCGVCGGRKLKPGVYCLWCDRQGAEPPIPKPMKAKVPKVPKITVPAEAKGPPDGPKPAGLIGGVGKPRVKAKRKNGKVGTGRNSFDLEALRRAPGA